MKFADSHAHLNHPDFRNDVDGIAVALAEKGTLALNVAYDLDSAETAITLAEKYAHMHASAGIHPHDAAKVTDDDIRRLALLARHEKVVAVGETGLDYFRNRSPKEAQKKILKEHLKIAHEVKKPVILHCRDAFDDIWPILEKEAKTGGVLHCFSSGAAEARIGLELGFHISFAGNLTYKKAENLRDAVKIIPAEFLLVETDCPYLAPQSMRAKRNEPAFMPETAGVMAKVRSVTLEDIARITYANYQKLFLGLKPEHGETVYKIRDSIYINVTNSCTNRCVFCSRLDNPTVQGHCLRLAKEPSADEILAEIGSARPEEVVFCGYGEPTLRLEVIKEVASKLKERGLKVRLNTNGHANLIHKRNIVPELVGLVDVVSVSLNARDGETYNKICRPETAIKERAFDEVCDFLRICSELLPEVVATAVDVPEVPDMNAVREFAEKSLNVKFRLRAYNLTG